MSVIFSKSSGLNDSFFGKSQEPIRMLLEKDVEAFEQMSAIPKLFKKVSSRNFAEKITSRTSMGNFSPVGEGGTYPKAEIQEGYSKVVEPDTWKNQFSITKEMVEDNKLLEITQQALGFTDSYNRTRELFAGTMLAGGVGLTTTFADKQYDTSCADRNPLFAKDHPSITENTDAQSNLYADAFSVDALAAAETAMQNYKDDNGFVLGIAPDTIVIPNEYTLKRDVFAAIGADKDPATANNGFNYQYGRWNVIVWPYLGAVTGATKPWILLDSHYNNSRAGLVWVDRIPLSVHSWVDENNDNNVWNGRARFSAGFNNWRAVCIGGVTGGTQLVSA